MKNKALRSAITVLFVLLGLGVYLLFANWSYLVDGPESVYDIPAEEIELVNFVADDVTYVAQEDPQMYIRDINGYVDTVTFHMGSAGQEMRPQVYYTEKRGEDFSEEKSFYPTFDYINDLLTIRINRRVSSLRVDPVMGGEFRIRLVNSSLTPAPFRYTITGALMSIFVACLFLIPLYYPASSWKNAGAYWSGMRKFSFLLKNLVKKDITTKYRRSVLGILWSVLNPLMMMLVITAVFQRLFRFEVENFPLYYLTGSLIFNFVTEATSTSMTSIVSAGPLIRKVYIPKYIFPLEKCLFASVNMLFSLIAVLIMFAVLRFAPPPTVLLAPIPMVYAFVFSVGFGMILAAVNVFFRDVGHLYSVWTTAWMYLTPIIYPEEILPGAVMAVVRLNPLYYYVKYFRDVTMYGIVPGVEENLICMFFSVAFLLTGLLVFKKTQDRFILYI